MAFRVGALLLAAGFSKRFGSSKLLAELNCGHTVYAQTRDRLAAAVEDYAVVTRPEIAELLTTSEPNLHVFPHASKGMGASLAFGIELAESKHWDAALICLADMPFISTSTYLELAAAARKDAIVVPCFDGKNGNPVSFGSQFYGDLKKLQGDAGGKKVMQKHESNLVKHAVNSSAVLADIDTLQDLGTLQTRFQ